MNKYKRIICEKKDWKNILLVVIMILLILFAIGCVGYASVMQMVLSYERFGVVFNESIFIPHESAWWYLGGLAYIPAQILIELW